MNNIVEIYNVNSKLKKYLYKNDSNNYSTK